jgi:hypothetical protein
VLTLDGAWYTDRENWTVWMRAGMLKRVVLSRVIEDLILHPEKWQEEPDTGPGQNLAPEQPAKESGLPPIQTPASAPECYP